jgi:hypothetical protein
MKAESKSMTAQSFGKRKSAAPNLPAGNPVRKAAPPPLMSIAPFAQTPMPGDDLARGKDSGVSGGTPAATLATPQSTNVGGRADLATFFGPGSDRFLDVYDTLNAKPGSLSFNWPVFGLSFVWFFYRKMYLIGAVFVTLPIVMGYLLPFGAEMSGAVLAWFADRAYFWEAKRHINEATDLGLTGEERSDYLRRKGGVSLPAAIVAGLFYAAMGVLPFLR